jgi:hypothetical protein
MQARDIEYFRDLKKEVANTFRAAFPASPADIEEWKGQDIVNFQEELMMKVNGRISEKWFYTHIKGQQEKLPRIDMLNLLSEYAGYKSWNDFVATRRPITEPGVEPAAEAVIIKEAPGEQATALHSKPKNKKVRLLMLTGLLAAIVPALLVIFNRPELKTYRCCFVDMNGRPPIPNARIEVRVLSYDESPVLAEVDSNGCIELKTREDKVRFVIASPYYIADSVTRVLTSETVNEKIKLRTNDYALMIHYFSTSKVNDWKKRRVQLDDMIADNAKIFQVYDDNRGMELYNKDEFVDKLTMPLKSLKNIEVIETRYTNNRISELRFRQKE